MAKFKGEWRKCQNPNCGGMYHVDENKVIDKYCKCKKKAQDDMMEFNRTLSRLA